MATYFYQILLSTGREKLGFIDLNYSSIESVKYWIETKYDGYVVKIYEIPIWLTKIKDSFLGVFSTQIDKKELYSFLYDLAVMMQCGITIADAVEELSNTTDNKYSSKKIIDIALQLHHELNSGSSVSEAFDRMKNIFPMSVRSLIKIGDETGTLDKMLMEAANHLQRINDMKSNIKQAMIYPAFVFFAIFGVSAFWIIYVIPNLSSLFKQMNAKLPDFTLAVLNGAEFISDNWTLILSLILIFFIVNIYSYHNFKIYKFKLFYFLHKLPISNKIVSSSVLAFYSEYLSVFIRSGVEIILSLKILKEVTTDPVYEEKISKISHFVENGDLLSTAMKRTGGFPPVMLRLIVVGEKTGTLDQQLSMLSVEYSKKLNGIIATLSEILKPLVILVAGGIFTIMIVALMLPIYDLISQAMSGSLNLNRMK